MVWVCCALDSWGQEVGKMQPGSSPEVCQALHTLTWPSLGPARRFGEPLGVKRSLRKKALGGVASLALRVQDACGFSGCGGFSLLKQVMKGLWTGGWPQGEEMYCWPEMYPFHFNKCFHVITAAARVELGRMRQTRPSAPRESESDGPRKFYQ